MRGVGDRSRGRCCNRRRRGAGAPTALIGGRIHADRRSRSGHARRAGDDGLEAALAQVTDRDGRPIAEHIDAETSHVDELRVPDDTGPLLRRALDHVEHHEPGADEAPADGTD